MQATAAAQINASVLTAGDYTVYVTGLPRNVTNAELIEYASHYGEVMSATPEIVSCGGGQLRPLKQTALNGHVCTVLTFPMTNDVSYHFLVCGWLHEGMVVRL